MIKNRIDTIIIKLISADLPPTIWLQNMSCLSPWVYQSSTIILYIRILSKTRITGSRLETRINNRCERSISLSLLIIIAPVTTQIALVKSKGSACKSYIQSLIYIRAKDDPFDQRCQTDRSFLTGVRSQYYATHRMKKNSEE